MPVKANDPLPSVDNQQSKLEQPKQNEMKKSPITKAQKLKELKQLLDEKLINNQDYEKQKQKILDEQ